MPATSILEIAPGVGRWTPYLLAECERLTAVDVTPECIDICRERFAGAQAVFHVNDGQTLPMVPDGSLDFAFSLDSLVHVEAPQLREYLRELARTLAPGGAAFLHHSNLGGYVDARTGEVAPYVWERHWRAQSVSARLVREWCREAGLACLTQELINWIGRDEDVDRHRLPSAHIPLTDCFSLCVRQVDGPPACTTVYLNHGFVDEWRELVTFTAIYATTGAGSDAAAERHAGRAAPASRRRSWLAGLRPRFNGYVTAYRDPYLHTTAGRCPDCGQAATRHAGGMRCDRCRASFRSHAH